MNRNEQPESQKRFFRVGYPWPGRPERHQHPHQLRDGDAFIELTPSIQLLGYQYSQLIMNYRPNGGSPDLSRDLALSFNHRDLLVLTTRPPLNDVPYRHKRVVDRSGSWLEKQLFRVFRQYFNHCSRHEVTLTDDVIRNVPDEFKNRGCLDFYMDAEATYKHSCLDGEERTARFSKRLSGETRSHKLRSAAFLLHTPSIIWQEDDGEPAGHGPEILLGFGMGGTIGLVWAYLLSKKHPELLKGHRFLMAELVRDHPLPSNPISLSFADHWKVEIIFDQPLPLHWNPGNNAIALTNQAAPAQRSFPVKAS
jgi:hypothetical protein